MKCEVCRMEVSRYVYRRGNRKIQWNNRWNWNKDKVCMTKAGDYYIHER